MSNNLNSIDKQVDLYFQPISDAVSDVVFYSVSLGNGLELKLILVWLVLPALFFTIYLGFVNFRFFKHSLYIVSGKFDKNTDDGQISSFQALMASLSGTVGLGNIAGVAVAVSAGGPGAVFWMILMGILSMSTKFAEVTLGVKYRYHTDPKNPKRLSGGPMYYLRDGFAKHNLPVTGKVIAAIFALCCIGGSIGGGNMFQANQAFQQVYNVTGGENGIFHQNGWIFGIILAIMTGVVIIGGIRSIASVSAKIVPIMGIIYMAAGLVVIAMNLPALPAAFAIIFKQALTLEAGFGGLLGGLLVGVQRAVFSNESGLGSAAIVYSAARAKNPVVQGMASMLGPFIDTVVICTITALVIILSGAYLNADGVEGVELTSRALASGIDWFPYILALTVFLFAYSTLITWSYYGQKALTYLFGQKTWIELTYKIFFCFCIIIGASAELGNIIAFTDAMILSMGIPNIIGLYLLAPEIKRDLKSYIEELKSQKSG